MSIILLCPIIMVLFANNINILFYSFVIVMLREVFLCVQMPLAICQRETEMTSCGCGTGLLSYTATAAIAFVERRYSIMVYQYSPLHYLIFFVLDILLMQNLDQYQEHFLSFVILVCIYFCSSIQFNLLILQWFIYSEYQLPPYSIKYKIRNQMLDIAIQWSKTVTM